MIDKINKLSIPATILISVIILGGFYFATEVNKQASIERQQRIDLKQKQDEEQTIKDQDYLQQFQKAQCVKEAQQTATKEYQTANCDGTEKMFVGSSTKLTECYNGTYLVAQYNNAYDTCLESKGLK